MASRQRSSIITALLLWVVVHLEASPRLRIAVGPFTDLSQGHPTTTSLSTEAAATTVLPRKTANAIAAELARTDRYEVVEIPSVPESDPGLSAVLTEHERQVQQALTAARAERFDLLLVGSINSVTTERKGGGRLIDGQKLGAELWVGRIAIEARLIDVATGQDFRKSVSEGAATLVTKEMPSAGGLDSKEIEELLTEALPRAAEAVAHDCVPVLDQFQSGGGNGAMLTADATLRGEWVYLTVGADVGVQKGDLFTLFALGESFSLDGEALREETSVGTLLVTRVHAKYARGGAPEKLLNFPTPLPSKIRARRQLDATGRRGPGDRTSATAEGAGRTHPRTESIADSPEVTDASLNPPRALRAQTRYIGIQAARLRSGPGTDFPIRSILAPGTEVETGSFDKATFEGAPSEGDHSEGDRSEDGWILIRTKDSREGWVFATLLASPEESATEPPTPRPGTAPPSRQPTYRNVGHQAARLRAGPGTATSILAVLPPGSPCELIHQQGEWSQVRTDQGLQGWVYTPLIAPR